MKKAPNTPNLSGCPAWGIGYDLTCDHSDQSYASRTHFYILSPVADVPASPAKRTAAFILYLLADVSAHKPRAVAEREPLAVVAIYCCGDRSDLLEMINYYCEVQSCPQDRCLHCRRSPTDLRPLLANRSHQSLSFFNNSIAVAIKKPLVLSLTTLFLSPGLFSQLLTSLHAVCRKCLSPSAQTSSGITFLTTLVEAVSHSSELRIGDLSRHPLSIKSKP